MKTDDLKVRIGSSMHNSGGQIINVRRIIVHPKFSSRTVDHDISLLQLSETLNLTTKIQPISLPAANANIVDGTLCTTSGWGEYEYCVFQKMA